MQSRRIIGWSLAAVAILLLVAAGSGILVLRSRYFAHYALGKIVSTAEQSTGGKTEIANLDFSLSSLTAHLYNITVHGAESPDQQPLFHADKVTVTLTIESVLRRKIGLSELTIEKPSVHLLVSANGQTNLPQPPPSQGSSGTNVFEMAVRHALVTEGQMNYNDRKTPLDADLHNLGIDVHFDPLTTSYVGSLRYDDGRLRYAKYQALPHDLNLKFTASPTRFSLNDSTLRIASSTLSLRAAMTNYANPVVDGTYEVGLHTQDFASMSPTVTAVGNVASSGTLHYQNYGNQPLLQNLAVKGKLASEVLSASSPEAHLEVRKLQGNYQLSHGTLRADAITAELLGGGLSASLNIEQLDSTPSVKVSTELHGISLRAAQQSVRSARTSGISVLGTLSGNASAAWTGSIQNIRAHSDLILRDSKAASAPSTNEIPLTGEIHAAYDGPSGALTLRQTRLQAASTNLTAQGEISNGSNLRIQTTVGDLRQVLALASAFSGGNSTLAAASGSLSADAVVRGSVRQPRIAGQVNAQNLRVQGSEWLSAKAQFQVSSSQLQIEQASLISAHQGSASVTATVGLRDWKYLPSSPIRAKVQVQQMPLTDLQRLANVQYPVSGDLSADVSLAGTQLDPSGSGTAHLTNASAYNEGLQSFSVKFQAANGTIKSTVDVAAAAGSATAQLSYTPQSKAYTFQLKAPSVALQKLHSVQAKNLPITGTLAASAQGEGTLDHPQLNALIESSRLQLKENSVSDLKAEVRVANQRADFSLTSQAAQSSIKAEGHVNLDANYYAEGSIDTTSIPLDLLLAAYLPNVPQGVKGQTELHATLKGPLKDKSQIEAHLTIPVLNASYQSLNIAAQGPISADYARSFLTIQPAEIRGTGTSLQVQGGVSLGAATPTTLSATGTVDVRILSIFAPDVQSAGTLTLDVHASGSAANPSIRGQINLRDIALSSAGAPLGIEKLNGTLDVTNDRIQVSSLTGQVGGGQLSARGSITYRPSVEFNLALQSKSIRLRYPDGLRMLLDGNLALTGTTEASTLNGRILVDSLSFTPDFDLAKFGDQFGGGNVPGQPGFADNIRLAIGVQSKDHLTAASSQISIEGDVNLQVIGTAANPVITGRTDLTSGELFYRNLRYQLQRGIITFDNPTQTEPKMDVSATTTVEQYNLTINLRGTPDKLETFYTSDPPLATADVINLLARGNTTQEAAAASQSTDSMIASQAASQVSSGVQKLAGISSLQIDPLIGGNNTNPSARIAVQQRVTKNLLFTFSTDVTQPGSEIVEGDYQLNKRWSVSVARDQLGGVSVDGRYHTKF